MLVYFYAQALVDYRINEKILNYISEINNTDAEFGVEECEVFLTFLYVILVMSMITGYVCFFIGTTLSDGNIFEYFKFVVFIIIYLSWDVFQYDVVAEFIILIFFKAFSMIEMSVNEKTGTGTNTDGIDDYILFKLCKHFHLICFHVCLLFFNTHILETCTLALWFAKYVYLIIFNVHQKRIAKKHIRNKKNTASFAAMHRSQYGDEQIPQSLLETQLTTNVHAPQQNNTFKEVNSVIYSTKSQAPVVLFLTQRRHEQQPLSSHSLVIKLKNNRNAGQDETMEDLSSVENEPDLLSLSKGNDVDYSSHMVAGSKYLYNQGVLSIVKQERCCEEAPQLMDNRDAKRYVLREESYITRHCTISHSTSDHSTIHGNNEASGDTVYCGDVSFTSNLTKDSASDSCNEGDCGNDISEDDFSVCSHFNLRPLTLPLPSYGAADVNTNHSNSISNDVIIHADSFSTPHSHIEIQSMFYNKIFLCLLGIIFIIFNTYEILFEIKMYALLFRTIVFDKSLYCQNFILFNMICTFEVGLIYYVRYNISFDILTSRYNSVFSIIICACCLAHLVMLKFNIAAYSWLYLFITSQLVVAPLLVLNQIYNNSFYFRCRPKDKIIMILIRDSGSTICIIISILVKLFILNNLYIFDVLYYYDYIFIIMLVFTIFYHKTLL